MRRRRAVATAGLVAIALVVALVTWRRWRPGGEERTTAPGVRGDGARPRGAPARSLEVARFRAHVDARRAAAAQLRGRPPGASRRGGLVALMMGERCLLGPGELCALIGDTLAACEAGDGEACLAAGHYLEDHPPRAMIVVAVYHRGCDNGAAAACDRVREIKEPGRPLDDVCADDPVACAWAGMRAKDRDALDQACADGVADACAMLLELIPADDPAARDYLTISCELGNPMACQALAQRLSPACRAECYPADPVAAAVAATIACEAGFADACGDP